MSLAAAGTPWVELYRPKSLKDVSHQSEVIATLQNAVETGRMPHLLFYGPPGSGKVRLLFVFLCDFVDINSLWFVVLPFSDICSIGPLQTTVAPVGLETTRLGTKCIR